MSFFKRLFKLPGPRDLGMSEVDALQSREFTPDCKGPTWEDWHIKVKQMHPVKYFFLETVKYFFLRKIWWKFFNPIKEFYYFLSSHLIPSRRYHFLDLRQPYNTDHIDHYRYGWADVPEKMLYAMFNLLGEYLHKERPHDLSLHYSREEINKNPGFKAQQDAIDEARAIYHWWTVERKSDYKIYNNLLHEWCEQRTKDKVIAKKIYIEMKDKEEFIENKTDEMVLRLMKIRRTLWT